MKRIILLLLLLLLNTLLHDLDAQTGFNGWLASFNTIKVSNKVSLHTDIQLRTTDKWEGIQTVLLRPGINYHLNKKLVLSAGYAYTSNRRVIGAIAGYAPEHRIWEQLLINHRLERVLISHRFRLEQRFITKSFVAGDELEHEGIGTAHRFRYFIRNVLPLKKENTFTKGVFAALQNEVFINTGNNENVNGEFFDQNRFYIAGGYRINPKTDLEIGYLNQYINGRGSQSGTNHVIQFAGYLRL